MSPMGREHVIIANAQNKPIITQGIITCYCTVGEAALLPQGSKCCGSGSHCIASSKQESNRGGYIAEVIYDTFFIPASLRLIR